MFLVLATFLKIIPSWSRYFPPFLHLYISLVLIPRLIFGWYKADIDVPSIVTHIKIGYNVKFLPDLFCYKAGIASSHTSLVWSSVDQVQKF